MTRPTSVAGARARARSLRENRGRQNYSTDTALQRALLTARAERGDKTAQEALKAYTDAQAAQEAAP